MQTQENLRMDTHGVFDIAESRNTWRAENVGELRNWRLHQIGVENMISIVERFIGEKVEELGNLDS